MMAQNVAPPSEEVAVTPHVVVVVDVAGSLGDFVMTVLGVEPQFCVLRIDRSHCFPENADLIVVDEGTSEARRWDLVQGCRAPIFVLGRDIDMPFDVSEFRTVLKESCRSREIPMTEDFVAVDPATRSALRMVERIADHPRPVLLWGPPGAGKKSLARRLHARSGRAGPLVVVGAAENIERATAEARGGTLFIEDVGDRTDADTRRLIALCAALGGEGARGAALSPDVRLIAATRRDLGIDMACGLFPADLYFRLAAFVLGLPALRERPRDLEALIDRFHARHPRAQLVHLSREAHCVLMRYSWPLNVRELQEVMNRILNLAPPGTVSVSELVVLAPEVFQTEGRTDLRHRTPGVGRALAAQSARRQ